MWKVGFQVDHQLEHRRLFDREIGSPGPLEDLVHVRGRPPKPIRDAWPVSQKTPGIGDLTHPEHRRQAAPDRVIDD
jgi:hypothetical protein